MPLLMFCVAFGLSMDYEVFLLSRIREAWLESGPHAGGQRRTPSRSARPHRPHRDRRGVADGDRVRRDGGSKVSFMMLFGTGLTLAVLMDATVVRGTLVPAFMKLAGPLELVGAGPLARLHAASGCRRAPPRPEPEPTGAH